MNAVRAIALTPEVFAPFGEVVQEPEFDPADPKPNRRYDDLVPIDAGPSGAPMVSLLRMREAAQPPYRITKLERHPLGSQAFIPCKPARFLLVVAPGTETPDLDRVMVFVTNGSQGVNYHRGVWHAPMMVLSPTTLVIVDRKGPGANCDLFDLPAPMTILAD